MIQSMNEWQQRNRQNMLENVCTTWIEGVLQPALAGETAVFDLAYQPYVAQQQVEAQPPLTLAELAERVAAGAEPLLILGEPGSGKTLTLLQLAQRLWAAAQAEARVPIPVVLNLAAWGLARGALADWLVEEMLLQYGAPRQVSREWLARGELVLLLDGLDEVAADGRLACVRAINAFQGQYGLGVVVCSRLAEYEMLGEEVEGRTAVVIRPLTSAQIMAHLAQNGPGLAGLQRVLAADAEWRNLAASPLLLTWMMAVYRQVSALPEADDMAAKREQLLAAYGAVCGVGQALAWLPKFAQSLQAQAQSIFYIERLCPDWLADKEAYDRLMRVSRGLLGGLVLGVMGGLMAGLVDGLYNGLKGGLLAGLLFGVLGSVIMGWQWGGDGSVRWVEEVRWQRPSSGRLGAKLKEGLPVGILFGLLSGLGAGLSDTVARGVSAGVGVGLSGGLLVGLQAVLRPRREAEQAVQPNQRVWTAWTNMRHLSVMYGLVGVVSVGLSVGMHIGLYFESLEGMFWALWAGAGLGLGLGLMGGLMGGFVQYDGHVLWRHYGLRWLLARQGILPVAFRDRQLVAALDGMVQRQLLRRVGNGWQFADRSLRAHLAARDEF
ncbi:MAG: NACHT domain-containing protein [Ardenticatenaceae bacterium]|nr:NACHT domain-containing protein [Ardenticatenaceae bacterium]